MQETSKKEALLKAKKLCSKQEKCIQDIRKKLVQWQVEDKKHDEIIDELLAEKYIDELRYAGFFVNDKFKFNKWGKIKIAYMLGGKGIPGHIVQAALDEIDEQTYRAMVIEELEKKNQAIKDPNPYTRKQKLVNFAKSRGYGLEMIYCLFS